MFLYGHDLYGVVAVGGDARQYLVAEFNVRSDAFAFLCHAYMALIDQQWPCVGVEVVNFPFIGLRIPHLC